MGRENSSGPLDRTFTALSETHTLFPPALRAFWWIRTLPIEVMFNLPSFKVKRGRPNDLKGTGSAPGAAAISSGAAVAVPEHRLPVMPGGMAWL